jgi:hypothetical protein
MLVCQFGGINKAGEALKSSNGWNEDCNETNSSGLSGGQEVIVLPVGFKEFRVL